MAVFQITVDPVACEGYGYCAELVPEAITIDEWGYPMLDDRPLPAELMAVAKRAVRDCPTRALALRKKVG
jgi:ferredoxin